ncbi:uncharacterized protein LOC117109957 [Anneissia japonica]|uniref:uncharacterized protein LOC117109957 n=1 Tax=Anneissia japonica TaxID=1529436 RepID=UPI001425510A|nr:uncharacterized protein LOC117109957 [Anneissia japonica]
MSKKQAIKVMSTLASYRIMIPVTVFVYSEFAEEWPDLVKSWATTYNIGLRGTHPYPPGNFEKMSPNWIREAVVSAELLLHELGIIPMYYLFDSVEDDKNVIEVLTKRGFRIIRPESNFPPKFKHTLTVDNYYKFRDVERVPKALRVIYEQLKAANGGILSLNTNLPDTFMNLVFLLDYLVENSGSSLTSLDNCIT